MNNKPRVCIWDIDGVILENKNWTTVEEFYQTIGDCIPQDWSVITVNALHEYGIKIIFLTARDEKYRKITEYQLKQVFDFPLHLYMRSRDDLREDYIVKKDYIEQLRERYEILFCIDDNTSNCQMYKAFGLPTLQVYNT